MHFLLFSLFFFGAFASPTSIDIAKQQIFAASNALKTNNQAEFFKLVSTTEADKAHYAEFSKKMQGVTMTVESAQTRPDGDLEVIVKVNNVHQAIFFMKQTSTSPTGWTITALGQPETNSRKMASWWSMCYVGLFWCAIELVAVWAVGY